MALFGKKNKTIDLTERYMKQKERAANLRESAQQARQPQREDVSNSANGFGFLAGLASSAQENSQSQSSGYPQPAYQTYGSNSQVSDAGDAEEKRKKLAKRLMDITGKLEEISNQIYHLQQRVELLEKKTSTGYGY